MSNEIDEILAEDDVEAVEETVETETVAKKSNLDFLTKPVGEMTTDDAEALRKYALTQKAQKEHFKSKVSTTKVETQTLIKPNTEQPNLTEEIDIRFLKRDGVSDEDLEQLKFIQAGLKATGKDVSLMEAQNHDLYKSYLGSKALEERRNRAQLISNGSAPDSSNKMTEEDFESNRQAKAAALLERM